ncbi:MAG: phage tail protein [Erythrobacter sp.]|nr:phage tail protein [Erythrobacter sp.]
MRRFSGSVSALALAGGLGFASMPAQAAIEPYIGEIQITGTTFCPRGYFSAEGQLLQIAQYSALFSLLGTTYGGDGRTTFALPDLRGRVPMGQGSGPGLTNWPLGSQTGTQTNTMTSAQLPSHSHVASVNVARVNATTRSPVGMSFSRAADSAYDETAVPSPTYQMNAGTLTIDNAGNSQPINNLQPSLVLRFCVAAQGIFPSRN